MCPYLAGVHAQNQEFNSGGGPSLTPGKQSGQRFFFFFFFFFFFYSPKLILQLTEGVQWFYYRKKLYLSKDPEGSRIFQGEGV